MTNLMQIPKFQIRITDPLRFALASTLLAGVCIGGLYFWPEYKVYTMRKKAEGEVMYLQIRGVCPMPQMQRAQATPASQASQAQQ